MACSTASRTSSSPIRGRNGFLYLFERANGQTVLAKPYMDNITWTKGIDQKTGRPLDYDPKKDIQLYSGVQGMTLTDPTKKLCPSQEGGNNYWSASYSPKTKMIYIPSRPTCIEATVTPDQLKNAGGAMLGGRFTACCANRVGNHPRRSLHRRDQEQGPLNLPELQRRADDRGRPAVHGARRRNIHRL